MIDRRRIVTTRALIVLCLSLSTATACHTSSEPPIAAEWETLPSLPVAVRAPATVAGGVHVYVVGGTSLGDLTPVLQILDLRTRTWSYGASVPTATDWGAAAWIGERLHFVGGVTAATAASRQHWIYDPVADRWMAGTLLPSAAAGSAIAVSGSRLFVLGGIDGPSAYSANAMIYDSRTRQWSRGGPVPSPRINWAGATVGGRIFAVGGGTPGLATTDELVSYDPSTDAWTQLTPMPMAREAHGAAAVGTLFCAAGGRRAGAGNFNPPFDDASCYDVRSARWIPKPALPRARQELGLVSVGNFVIAVGGRDNSGNPVGDVTRLRVR
jgi:N-acetylneuraminic acid mutarotase